MTAVTEMCNLTDSFMWSQCALRTVFEVYDIVSRHTVIVKNNITVVQYFIEVLLRTEQPYHEVVCICYIGVQTVL